MNNFNGIDKVGSMLNLISQKQKALSINLANIDYAKLCKTGY